MVYTVAPTGVGRKDYSSRVEASTEAFIGATPTQAEYAAYGYYTLPCRPFALGYDVPLLLPQEDGTYDYEADLPVLFHHVRMSISDTLLVAVSLRRWASVSDFIAGILAERFAVKFSYGHSDIKFLRGIRTARGSVYTIFFAAWGGVTFDVAVGVNGLGSELTPPWWG